MRDYNAFTENNVSQPGAGRARSEGKWEVMRSRDFLLGAGIGLFGALARTSNTAVPGGPQAAPLRRSRHVNPSRAGNMRSKFRAPTGQMTAVRSEKVAGVRLIDGAIFDSKGIAVVVGSSIFDLNGRKLYDLKGTQGLQALRRTGWPHPCGRAQLRKTF